MLNDCLCLGSESRVLSQLDPSRDAAAEEAYASCADWFEASDGRVRFSHNSISPYFRNGEHCFEATSELLKKLICDPSLAQRLPSLVCIKYQGSHRVIFGNRRLEAYKACAETKKSRVWFKMIVHKFPECGAILEPLWCGHSSD
jgi:hypothetical protein